MGELICSSVFNVEHDSQMMPGRDKFNFSNFGQRQASMIADSVPASHIQTIAEDTLGFQHKEVDKLLRSHPGRDWDFKFDILCRMMDRDTMLKNKMVCKLLSK